MVLGHHDDDDDDDNKDYDFFLFLLNSDRMMVDDGAGRNLPAGRYESPTVTGTGRQCA